MNQESGDPHPPEAAAQAEALAPLARPDLVRPGHLDARRELHPGYRRTIAALRAAFASPAGQQQTTELEQRVLHDLCGGDVAFFGRVMHEVRGGRRPLGHVVRTRSPRDRGIDEATGLPRHDRFLRHDDGSYQTGPVLDLEVGVSTLVVAPAGRGKSSQVTGPAAGMAPGNVLCFGTKGEILKDALVWAHNHAIPSDQVLDHVFLFDPTGNLVQDGIASAKLPLTAGCHDYDYARQVAKGLASAPNPAVAKISDSGAFQPVLEQWLGLTLWVADTYDVLSAEGMAQAGKLSTNVGTHGVWALMSGGDISAVGDAMAWIVEATGDEDAVPADVRQDFESLQRKIQGVGQNDTNWFENQARPLLGFLANPAFRDRTTAQPGERVWDPETLAQTPVPTWVGVVCDRIDAQEVGVVLVSCLNSVTRAQHHHAAQQNAAAAALQARGHADAVVQPRLDIVVDEMVGLPRGSAALEAIMAIFSLERSSGVTGTFGVQGFELLHLLADPGEGQLAQHFKAGAGTILILGGNDVEYARAVSEMMGDYLDSQKVTTETISQQQPYAPHHPRPVRDPQPGPWSDQWPGLLETLRRHRAGTKRIRNYDAMVEHAQAVWRPELTSRSTATHLTWRAVVQPREILDPPDGIALAVGPRNGPYWIALEDSRPPEVSRQPRTTYRRMVEAAEAAYAALPLWSDMVRPHDAIAALDAAGEPLPAHLEAVAADHDMRLALQELAEWRRRGLEPPAELAGLVADLSPEQREWVECTVPQAVGLPPRTMAAYFQTGQALAAGPGRPASEADLGARRAECLARWREATDPTPPLIASGTPPDAAVQRLVAEFRTVAGRDQPMPSPQDPAGRSTADTVPRTGHGGVGL